MRVFDRIEQKLTTALAPSYLSIIDESDRHHGHADGDSRGESHFRLVIVSERFNGMPQIARQRMIYDLLRSELHDQIHALSMQTLTPDEESIVRTSRAL
ncbi:Cell division protein BolA [invertebrate metagenome]|uniref:Cell division protein BolA n=1 Tax=invertebrate metagenome TaxID=1711999 RepID=A0A484H7W5_9ZZZZ